MKGPLFYRVCAPWQGREPAHVCPLRTTSKSGRPQQTILANPDLKSPLIDKKNDAPVFRFLEMTLPPDNHNPSPPGCPEEESF